jgi:2-polyprenyl-3-methyl-5-hydroxy-6-metoxy-1,4-benzoquinol methylase
MLSRVSGTAEIWNIRAEELRVQDRGPFDVILCLWNVLGHLLTIEDRRRAMHAIADQLSPEGSFFIDVNHRYNACAYGIIPTAARFLNDIFFRPETTGDVVARWDFGEHSISTHGHFFTHREIRQLVRSAGLKIENRIAVDYNNGRIRRFGFQGNLLYILRRASPIDSPSAAHTS